MESKLYPFSVQKHAHSIEFRRNRAFCDMCEAEERNATSAEIGKLEDLYDALTDLLLAVMDSRDGRIAYLTGKQIGLAKETVEWASNSRAESLIARGKTEYLQYC